MSSCEVCGFFYLVLGLWFCFLKSMLVTKRVDLPQGSLFQAQPASVTPAQGGKGDLASVGVRWGEEGVVIATFDHTAISCNLIIYFILNDKT